MLQAEIPRPQPKIENLTTEMYSAYLKTHKKTSYTSFYGNRPES